MSTTLNSLSKDARPAGKAAEAENSLRPAKRRGKAPEPEVRTSAEVLWARLRNERFGA